MFIEGLDTEYPTIQDAIEAAKTGDTILVADGKYTVGGVTVVVDFLGEAITVRSKRGNPKNCIIDGGRSTGGFIF